MRTAKKTYETTDYASMMKRMMKAHGRRVADGDVEDLEELMALQGYLDLIVRGAVQAQREVQGRSWADIARAAGTSRQAAQKKFG
ncbi:helix-turn-helix DNA binding domain protein [Arthrobacter phage Noely]|uniref:Helix-turn-helix DNA binding domain protein n=1 Tax=Arthrobacter phage Noely TaxID=2419964 RepID=A0A3G2KAF2_9CAUD|nr:helix-turn-helix DNA binding domain protein [Arthrobacter phage Noely]AYN55944.1 helix-turn-helix DNA binding domain protein [Arthrobacter phage Noely]